MKQLKRIATFALATTTFVITLSAGSASATTLEVEGVKQNKSVEINLGVRLGTSAVLRDTFGFSANTCTESRLRGETEWNFSSTPTGKLTTLMFGKCAHTVTVHNPGRFYVEWISGTTNGTVYSEEAEFTTYSTIHGTHINCKTGFGTPIGTLTGNAGGFSSFATLDVNATLDCGSHLSSAKWTGTYTTTWTEGLGVVS